MRVIVSDQRDDIGLLKKQGPRHDCGSAACVIGHFPVIFPEDWEYFQWVCGTLVRIINSERTPPRHTLKEVAKYLGISDEAVCFLFSTYTYPANVNPTYVASRISWFVDNKPDESELYRIVSDCCNRIYTPVMK